MIIEIVAVSALGDGEYIESKHFWPFVHIIVCMTTLGSIDKPYRSLILYKQKFHVY